MVSLRSLFVIRYPNGQNDLAAVNDTVTGAYCHNVIEKARILKHSAYVLCRTESLSIVKTYTVIYFFIIFAIEKMYLASLYRYHRIIKRFPVAVDKKYGFKAFGWYRIIVGSIILIMLLAGQNLTIA